MNCPAALLLVGTSTPSPSRPLDQVNTVRVHSHQSQPTYLITSLPEQRRPRRPTYLPTYLPTRNFLAHPETRTSRNLVVVVVVVAAPLRLHQTPLNFLYYFIILEYGIIVVDIKLPSSVCLPTAALHCPVLHTKYGDLFQGNQG